MLNLTVRYITKQQKMKKIARVIAQTVYQFDPHLKLMGLAGSLMLCIAEEEKLQTISEVFCRSTLYA